MFDAHFCVGNVKYLIDLKIGTQAKILNPPWNVAALFAIGSIYCRFP